LIQPFAVFSHLIVTLGDLWLKALDIDGAKARIHYRTNNASEFEARLEVLILSELGYEPGDFDEQQEVLNFP
jgi:hypothetical protein